MSQDANRILLIEDDPDLLRLLGGLLSVFGYQTICAKHGASALEKLHGEDLPQIIVLDWFMPILSGEEFLQAKRGLPRIRDIPVIVMSGAKDIRHLMQNREEVRLVLEKPVGIDELVQAIQSTLATK